MRRRSLRGGSVSPVPDWRAFVIAKNERSRTLYNFAREDNICCILLDFRPREGDIVPLLETNAHVIEKGLRAEIHVNGFRPVLQQQVGRFLFAPFGGPLWLF